MGSRKNSFDSFNFNIQFFFWNRLIHQVSVVSISNVCGGTSKYFHISESPRLLVFHPVDLLPVNGHRVVNLESGFLVAKVTLELVRLIVSFQFHNYDKSKG